MVAPWVPLGHQAVYYSRPLVPADGFLRRLERDSVRHDESRISPHRFTEELVGEREAGWP